MARAEAQSPPVALGTLEGVAVGRRRRSITDESDETLVI